MAVSGQEITPHGAGLPMTDRLAKLRQQMLSGLGRQRIPRLLTSGHKLCGIETDVVTVTVRHR